MRSDLYRLICHSKKKKKIRNQSAKALRSATMLNLLLPPHASPSTGSGLHGLMKLTLGCKLAATLSNSSWWPGWSPSSATYCLWAFSCLLFHAFVMLQFVALACRRLPLLLSLATAANGTQDVVHNIYGPCCSKLLTVDNHRLDFLT